MSKLYYHQQEGIDFLKEKQGGFLAFAMGLGKTRIVLEYFKLLKSKGYKLLIICPLSLIECAWHDDINKFAPEMTFIDLRGKKRYDADIYAINYESLIQKKRYIEVVNLIRNNEFVCCLDESSRISNHKAKTTKAILSIRDFFKVKICLSGTPCSQNDTQWWSQCTFLRDDIVHKSFFGFKNTYFHLERNGSEMPLVQGVSKQVNQKLFMSGWKVAITEPKRLKLLESLKKVVLWRKLDECIDLPPETDEIREVIMSPEQTTAHKMMKKECIAEINEKAIVAQMALTKLMKLRQITSGFAFTPDGETQRFKTNPKLKELKATLEELGNEQAIIFFNFRAEAADIVGLLGDKCHLVDGSITNKTPFINDFKAGGRQYLVANIKSLAHGVTLTNARYCIYYSHSYSAEDFVQSRARIRRISQERPCFYIHLLCKDAIDRVIYDVLSKKQDALTIVEEMLK